jgi:hypothetical protein
VTETTVERAVSERAGNHKIETRDGEQYFKYDREC